MEKIDITKFLPVGCGVVIEEAPDVEAKVGEIIIAETENRLREYAVGKLISLGPSAFRYLDEDEKNFEIGDTIIFVKNSGISLSPTGAIRNHAHKTLQLRLINDEDIKLVEKVS